MIELELEEITKQNLEEDKQLCFTYIPMWKIITLMILSCGAYCIFWFYKCWEKIKHTYNLNIRIIMRTIFMYFTCFRLFLIIKKHFNQYNIKYPAIFLAIILVIGNIACTSNDSSALLFIIPCIPILFTQYQINKINKFYFPENIPEKWTWKTTGFVILYWLIIIIFVIITELIKYNQGV